VSRFITIGTVPVVTFIYDNRFCEICQGGQFVLCPPQEVSPMHRLATNSLTGNWKPGGSNTRTRASLKSYRDWTSR